MIGPKTLHLLKFAEEITPKTLLLENPQKNLNIQFEEQREFGREFYRQLRIIIEELGGDLFILRVRKFDPKMWKLAAKVKGDLEKISMLYRENSPHLAVEKFCTFVLEKPNRDIIDNLDFLVQHHLKLTDPKVELSTGLKHVEVNSFKEMKALAFEMKDYITKNPPLPIPGSNPPGQFDPNPAADPAFLTDPEAKTNV